MALRPTHADALSNRGAALAKLGRVDEAEASITAALAVNPQHGGAKAGLERLFAGGGAAG